MQGEKIDGRCGFMVVLTENETFFNSNVLFIDICFPAYTTLTILYEGVTMYLKV